MSVLDGWTTANRVALAALALSAALAAAAAVDARTVDPLPGAPAPRHAAPMPEVAARAGSASDAAILAAVARDPFRPDRKRPPGRYRMPGEAAPAPVPPPVFEPPPQPINVRLLGTVVLPDGTGLAALAGPNGEGKVVRTGQSMEGYRLVRVTPGSATLQGNDTTVVLRTEVMGGTP